MEVPSCIKNLSRKQVFRVLDPIFASIGGCGLAAGVACLIAQGGDLDTIGEITDGVVNGDQPENVSTFIGDYLNPEYYLSTEEGITGTVKLKLTGTNTGDLYQYTMYVTEEGRGFTDTGKKDFQPTTLTLEAQCSLPSPIVDHQTLTDIILSNNLEGVVNHVQVWHFLEYSDNGKYVSNTSFILGTETGSLQISNISQRDDNALEEDGNWYTGTYFGADEEIGELRAEEIFNQLNRYLEGVGCGPNYDAPSRYPFN